MPHPRAPGHALHGQPSNGGDTTHLINLLDNEGEGGTVLWVEPQHREPAINARLALFRQTAMGDTCNTGEVESDDWPELSLSPLQVHQQEPGTLHRETHADYNPEVSIGAGVLSPNLIANGNQHDMPSEPSGSADVQGDATPPLSALCVDTGTTSPDRTPATLPTEQNFEHCNSLNDFAFDARLLRGPPQ